MNKIGECMCVKVRFDIMESLHAERRGVAPYGGVAPRFAFILIFRANTLFMRNAGGADSRWESLRLAAEAPTGPESETVVPYVSEIYAVTNKKAFPSNIRFRISAIFALCVRERYSLAGGSRAIFRLRRSDSSSRCSEEISPRRQPQKRTPGTSPEILFL